MSMEQPNETVGYTMIPKSVAAARTFNPIRRVVERIEAKPNPQKDLIPLSIGDPTVFGNFAHPESVKAVFQEKMTEMKSNGYAHSCGLQEAREAVAKKFSTNPLFPLSFDDVVMTSGCSQALDLAISALANPGKHNILLPKPGFPLYMTLCASKGIGVKYYNLIPASDWEIDLGHLESMIDKKTSAILINNPSNPCGAVYSRKHLEDICAVARKHNLPIISDEIYADMAFEPFEFTPLNNVSEDVPFLEVGGIAKQYMVPGWRVGWLLIHDRNNVLGEVKAGIHDLSTLILGPSSIVQAVVPHLLREVEGSYYKAVLKQLSDNANIIYNSLSDCPGLRCYRPQGAMYVLIEILDKSIDDHKFTSDLLSAESVFVLPGECFNQKNFFRVVISPPKEKIEEAMTRICNFCATYFDKTKLHAPIQEEKKEDTVEETGGEQEEDGDSSEAEELP